MCVCVMVVTDLMRISIINAMPKPPPLNNPIDHLFYLCPHITLSIQLSISPHKNPALQVKPSFVSKHRKKFWPSLSLWFIDHIHIPLQAILLNTNTIENNSHNFCLSTFASPPIHLLCLDGEKKLKKEQAIIQKGVSYSISSSYVCQSASINLRFFR